LNHDVIYDSFLSLGDRLANDIFVLTHASMLVLVTVIQDDSLRGGPEFIIIKYTIIY
jgi:hypothetical protein